MQRKRSKVILYLFLAVAVVTLVFAVVFATSTYVKKHVRIPKRKILNVQLLQLQYHLDMIKAKPPSPDQAKDKKLCQIYSANKRIIGYQKRQAHWHIELILKIICYEFQKIRLIVLHQLKFHHDSLYYFRPE